MLIQYSCVLYYKSYWSFWFSVNVWQCMCSLEYIPCYFKCLYGCKPLMFWDTTIRDNQEMVQNDSKTLQNVPGIAQNSNHGPEIVLNRTKWSRNSAQLSQNYQEWHKTMNNNQNFWKIPIHTRLWRLWDTAKHLWLSYKWNFSKFIYILYVL